MTTIAAKNPVSKFVYGFLCPFRSFGFVRQNPALYKFIILPFLINTVTFSLVVYFGLNSIFSLVMSKVPQGEAWYWLILNYLMIAVAILVVFVLVFFSFAVVGSLIASPFNDVLSERTASILTGKVSEEPFLFSVMLLDARRTLVVESKKIGVFLVGMLLLLFLHLIPVLGSALYPILSVGWTVFFLVTEYTGYVFTRKRYDFSRQRQTVFKYFALMFGFGVGLLCVLAIPFLQFMCIPLGVVGAVRLLDEVGEL
nr:EI24 domain-containing protein [Desulfobulbaceae bacterium]